MGGAGHAIEVCRKLSAKGRFIGIDQDQDAIIAASERLAAFDQVTIIRSNYCYMVQELAARGIHKVDGIVLDLGVSSYQLDNEERGFTYRVDAPLDMRMDQRQTQTASDIVNGYEERELYRIIRDYGEDKFAKNIAKHIVAARQQSPIMTTGQLTQIIRESIPMKIQAAGGHPAKRTFQAIRIEPVSYTHLGTVISQDPIGYTDDNPVYADPDNDTITLIVSSGSQDTSSQNTEDQSSSDTTAAVANGEVWKCTQKLKTPCLLYTSGEISRKVGRADCGNDFSNTL